MAAWDPAVLLLFLSSILSVSAGSDACGLQFLGQAWSAETLESFCLTPGHVAYRSPPCTTFRLCGANSSRTHPLQTGIRLLDSLIFSVCAEMPELSECIKLRGQFASETSYTRCMEHRALLLPATTVMETFLAEACVPGRRLAGCTECNAESCDTADPLLAYAAACAEIPGAKGCDPWIRFCAQEASDGGHILCLNPDGRTNNAISVGSILSVASSMGAGASIKSSGASAGAAPGPAPPAPCIADPSQPACKLYVYPDGAAKADVDTLCGSMSDMPGCAIARACEEADGRVADKYCRPFVLLATLCHDMPGMRGCENYKALCSKPGSVVQQCLDERAVPGAPAWSQARKAVFSACGDHPMAGCANCSKSDCPDPLASLADICHEMPDMAVCSLFWAFCNAAGAEDVAEWCEEDDSKYLPSMLMYFHQRTQELLLWKEWRPRTRGQYAASVVAIVAMGLVATGLKTVKGALVLRWNHDRALRGGQERPVTSVWMLRQGQSGEILAKVAITGVSLTLDYFNMLIAMTFNVGFFCAVIAGYILGTLAFSHVLENYGAILHQERRERSARLRLAGQRQPQLVSCEGDLGGRLNGNGFGPVGVALAMNGDKTPLLPPATTAGASASEDESEEEEVRLAIEGEGECNCVHSA